MRRDRKVRVLVVDDSILYREVLSKGISKNPCLEVVATAEDPFDARDKIIEYEPDVMTVDVEMPRMNGIEFIRRLMPQYPLPIVVVSTVSECVFDAMNAGAVDFVTKPDMRSAKSVESFIEELILKIKIASAARVSHPKGKPESGKVYGNVLGETGNRIIAIGASTGGTEAIYKLLRLLPRSVPGIVIAQHIPPVFSRMFAERLNSSTLFNVKEAKSGDMADKGCVLIAPGDMHMKVIRSGGKFKVECFEGERVNGHRPSVDVLFESAAREAGSRAVGVILTGMGYDGAKGLLSMRRKGARTIGQDEGSSVVYGMPKVAYDIGAVERQASLDNIPGLIYSMLR